jgi:non-specific serine/threonine protein kinase/serine/threonine-protein kinase
VTALPNPMSDAERWQRAKGVFQEVLERAPEARPTFLALACGEDADLLREVEALLVSHGEAAGFLSRPAFSGPALPDLEGRRIGPYRVLGRIGYGGMGVVHRAVRDDDVFHKVVALKLVHGGAAAEHQARLERERQILGRLQHPSIATILDGGTTDEGQPYLVMEYVDGTPLDAYCDARGLGTRERLALFRTVCLAVHYAHQNLVVHRDLKPANVLVTADGQPKLLDFGIAKLLAAGLDPDEAPTATLLPMMTPEYASPEQVRGQPVTTASDVYSLGVVLYELLTGARPYVVRADSLEEIVRAVCEPVPPSSAARTQETGKTTVRSVRPRPTASELKGDLDTIVLKAMRKEPSRRYQSALELAEDVRRHLEGLPVLARKDTVRYRLVKFVGRHRAAAATAALVFVSLIGGLAATVRQARIAEANRLRAERRFADVRQLANSFLFEIEAAIRDLPGSTPARRLVVEKALLYLDSLAQEASGDPVLQLELAGAYQKVGDVQGNPYGANMGDTEGAIASYRKEVAIREALGAGRDRRAARDLVAAYRRLGLLEDEAGQTQAGVQHLKQALDLGERLVAEDPRDDEGRRLLALVHDGAGLLALKTGDQRRAEEHQRRAVAIWEAEAKAGPDHQEALRGLHVAHGALARTLRVSGRLPEATAHYEQALEAAKRRLRLLPMDATARRDESNANTNLAVSLFLQGEFEQAAPTIAKSLAFDEATLRADPKNSQAQRDVSWDLGFLAELASAQGRLGEALAYQQRSLAMDEARAAAQPDSFQAGKDLAENWSAMSDLLDRLRRPEAALEASTRSVGLFEGLLAANPGQTRVQQLMAAQYGRHGAVLDALASRGAPAAGDHDARRRDACDAFRRGIDLWKDLEAKGAAIDDENHARRAKVEKAAARCELPTPAVAAR